jgi:hypothetical protein
LIAVSTRSGFALRIPVGRYRTSDETMTNV